MDEIAAAAEAIYRAKGWRDVSRLAYAPGRFDAGETVLRLTEGTDRPAVFLGGRNGGGRSLSGVGAAGLDPAPLHAGTSVGERNLPGSSPVQGQALAPAFPSLPADRREWGLREFEGVAGRQNLAVTHPTAQLTVFAGAKLLVEGLRRAGRDLSREKLVEAMEGLVDFDSGLTPRSVLAKTGATEPMEPMWWRSIRFGKKDRLPRRGGSSSTNLLKWLGRQYPGESW